MDSVAIRKLRLGLGLTPTQFAVKVGVSENSVRRWEIGDRHPSGRAVIAILGLAGMACDLPKSGKGRKLVKS